ncbi:hypothetical protein [Owenweeksia hongkongensis]|uniref:hypothetical protein n=1 Tax=Owenweeksia hongkongensis TaxID=253245 RepID=UPI003A93786A
MKLTRTSSSFLVMLLFGLLFSNTISAQYGHNEITLNAGIRQVSLDYAYCIGKNKRHIIETGFLINQAAYGVGIDHLDGESSGASGEMIYHFVLNKSEKMNLSIGLGYRIGTYELICLPLTFRRKFGGFYVFRARLTGAIPKSGEFGVMPSLGFGVVF